MHDSIIKWVGQSATHNQYILNQKNMQQQIWKLIINIMHEKSPISPSNIFKQYNVVFNYTHKKKTIDHANAFNQSNRTTFYPSSSAQLTSTHYQNKTNRTNYRIFPKDNEFSNCKFNYSRASMYSESKKNPSPNLFIQTKNVDHPHYLPYNFPQRRKKSTEPQLIKLLMKFSSDLSTSFRKNEKASIQKNSFNDHQVLVKAKYPQKSRLNWIKERYTCNRGKEQANYFPGEELNQIAEQAQKESLKINQVVIQR